MADTRYFPLSMSIEHLSYTLIKELTFPKKAKAMFKTRIIMHFNKAAAANLKTLYNLESVNAEGKNE